MPKEAESLARIGAIRQRGEAPPRDLRRARLFVWSIGVVAGGAVNNGQLFIESELPPFRKGWIVR